MTYGRVDDKLHSHPKIIALGPHMLAAVGLGTLAQSWSNDALTDGFIPAAQVPRLAGRGVGPLVTALVTVGLWEVVDGGWQIHDWTDWNLTRARAVELRTSRAEAGSLGGKQKASKRLANAIANGQQNRSPLDPRPNNQDQVKSPNGDSVARRVFTAWQQATGHTMTPLTTQRFRLIALRLKDGFDEADLMDAARGVRMDPWPERKLHDGFEIVFRNAAQVERFRDFYRNPPAPTLSIMGQQAATEAALRALL